MAIPFNDIPGTLRVPFTFVEFDNSKAQQGPAIQKYTSLIYGQKLAAGSAAVDTLIAITSDSQAETLFGSGSHLHGQVVAYRANDKVTELIVIAQVDAGGAVAATKTLTIVGTATADGTLFVYVAGRRFLVPVADADTETDVAAAVVAALAAEPLSYMSGGNVAGVVTFTAKNAGENGTQLDVRINFVDTDELPEGISSATVTDGVTGTGNPDVDDIIAVLPETQFNTISNPYTDSTNLGKIETEMDDRFGPLRQNQGVLFSASIDSLSNLTTLGNSRNSKHLSIMGVAGPSFHLEWASAYHGQVAKSAQADPALPFQTLPLVGILAPSDAELFTLAERNNLLFDGIATYVPPSGGVVRIERAITTFQTNDAGAPDTSFLDVNTLLTLSFLRFSFRTRMQTKYSRHKLANDGTRFGPGQRVITPLLGKAEAVALFAEWEEIGLVEGIEQFKRDLIVERNNSDPNRLDFLLPPDLINQLRVVGAQIQFLL